MKVWILQSGEPLHIDTSGRRAMRAMNLADALLERGHEVVLWSSDFDHFSKSHRFGTNKEIQISSKFKIFLIKSCGYRSNFGFRRLVDHAELGWRLYKEIKKEELPDVAFIGYPPIEPAFAMASLLKKNQIPTLLDTKDAWPDIIIDSFPRRIKPLAKIAFLPYTILMKKTFKDVSGISSISKPFLDWSIGKVDRLQRNSDQVFFLTAPEIAYTPHEISLAKKFWDDRGIFDDGRHRAYFVGSLNKTFDFEPFIAASRQINIEIIVAGDGNLRADLLDRVKELPNFLLPGSISEIQAYVLAERSTLAIAPIIPRYDFEMSVPNKFIDAFKYGKPMFSSITGVTADLLLSNKAGFIYSSGEELISQLEIMCRDKTLAAEMGSNAKSLYQEIFDYNKTYGAMVDHLEEMARIP